jgi:peroxiredoxin Q/BCP
MPFGTTECLACCSFQRLVFFRTLVLLSLLSFLRFLKEHYSSFSSTQFFHASPKNPFCYNQGMNMLHVGNKAPTFTLPDQDGKTHSLSDYTGKWVLLYFYPKDDTPGCTIEACSIRDQFKDFKKIGAEVIGISTDSVKSHKKFVDGYELPFTLLADEHKEMVGAYGVYGEKKFMGRTYMGTMRTSFLVDPKGKIAKVYEKVKPEVHAGEVIADLRSLAK